MSEIKLWIKSLTLLVGNHEKAKKNGTYSDNWLVFLTHLIKDLTVILSNYDKKRVISDIENVK